MNGLYHDISSWFLLDGGGYLEAGLEGLGFDARLKRIQVRLLGKIGKAELGELIRIHRNKFLVHNDKFGIDVHQQRIDDAAEKSTLAGTV